ncbi:glycoside hydrolase family 36 protein [Sphingomonas sp. 8AM]|uniref:glycoside hydrolase family 36 protein n=1 Tax=Sphingomonas sp. 8AM TaxID=2653170 RepID=UPI0012F36ECE|nr:glycoside hydrolase family 36 protein [Sphingomonas sp. 8AM]VXC99100.1 Glycoside hydrolase clan GH-D [Sphingomonas sp. 8AM]
MSPNPVTRRSMLARLMIGGAAVVLPDWRGAVWAAAPSGVRLTDGTLTIDYDRAMRAQLSFGGKVITGRGTPEALFVGGRPLGTFLLLDHAETPVSGVHGKGRRHRLRATAGGQVEQNVAITFLNAYPGLALYEVSYRNTGSAPLAVSGWRVATHDLLAHRDGAWTFAGASYPDRRDGIQKVAPGFDQRNFMGMNASDYGGGTPVAVVWRRDVGLAIGHVETSPRQVSLPVSVQPDATRLGLSGDQTVLLAPGGTLSLPFSFLMAHEGDHFRPLDAYRRLMAERGVAAPTIPEPSYGPIWCAWGYERDFTLDQVYGTLPKAKALGFEWAVLDDGWQTAEGDWKLNPAKFPGGDKDMRAFTDRIKADGMRPRLWLAPLAVDPGTDLLRDHADMLLLDRNGSAQNVSFWNAFTLCPAYQPTVDYFRALVRRIMVDWGYDGLKLDGQHLNGVAPCYNPAHRHERPEESSEKLQDFWKAIHDEAIAAKPEAVVELCPCGDSFAFHNLPATNNTPASDPLSSWQIRLKGKTFKALMGPSAPYAGDHVELSDGGDDFASTYGIGAIPSTKFTWPRDTPKPMEKLPPGGFVLTPAKEALWGKWVALYREHMLPKGRYLGGLYDIGFDKPEAHAIEKDGVLHFAFYADRWSGPIALRGLGEGDYTLVDGFSGTSLGSASRTKPTIDATFERALLVRATPRRMA